MSDEYIKIVKDIINSDEFIKRKTYTHHGKITVYDHSLKVSLLSYRLAKRLHLDFKSAAIGGILHDMYYNPWQNSTIKKPLLKKHGFVHAGEALENSKKLYPEHMNIKIEDIIKKHMFPLNISLPKYKESWIVTFCDKIVATNDYFDQVKSNVSVYLLLILSFFK